MGSGTGSAPEVNAEYMTFLEGLIRARGVSTIVEVGSDEWLFFYHDTERSDTTHLRDAGLLGELTPLAPHVFGVARRDRSSSV